MVSQRLNVGLNLVWSRAFLWTLVLAVAGTMARASDATVNWSDVHQRITGFGACSMYTADSLSDAQADLFFSPTAGIGLSLLRVWIQNNGTCQEVVTAQKAQ